ncbi:hypothetical protein ACQPZF_03255 [Actinosynnema sp. CS-041913]|uniref:hypothetical protein n=1 Tax=Actinosynnema sp. CS-041913 TaxID=3239917 RepID=UPI003D8C0543
MIENSSAGLVMLSAEATVTVTREEDHQAELARYPVTPGMQRHVAVELAWCTAATGKHKGERAIEVRLDGRRVGELTHLMSQRYAPLLVQLTTRGGRPGCEAVLQAGVRGTEVTLRLPRDGNATIPLATPPTYAPAEIPSPRRASPFAANRPAWIGAAAAVVIVFFVVVANTSTPTTRTAADVTTTSAAPTTTTTVPTTTTTITTTTTTTTVAPPPQATQPPAPKPPTVRTTEAPPPPPPAKPQSGCDSNYSGCVPIASDVDCQGGSGNGPAYVAGPIRVIGTDIYDLDRNGDGIACED